MTMVTSINSVYNDEYRATQTINPYYGQYVSSNGIVYKSHGRSTSYNLEQRLNWAHSYGNNNISAQLGHTTMIIVFTLCRLPARISSIQTIPS